MIAHVSEKKKKELILIKGLIEQYPVVGFIDMTNLPSVQLQKLRAKLNPQSFRNRERKFNNLAIVIRVIMMMSDDFTKYNVNN